MYVYLSKERGPIMYYFYQPYHYPFSYEPPTARSMHSELLHQPTMQRNAGTAKPSSPPPANQTPVYPPVNSDYFNESAKSSRKLLSEASLLLNHLATSKEFGNKVMTAAQRSDTAEVTRLIRSLGITTNVVIRYNPDGFHIEFVSQVKNIDCCRLTVALRWR